jgi:hypothetical protein
MKKNIAILLIVTLMVGLLSACQKPKQEDSEAGASDIITDIPEDENENAQTEDTQTEDTELTDNETGSIEESTTDENNQSEDDGKDTNQAEDTTTTDAKDTDKQESLTSTDNKDTGKQEDKKPTGGKDTSKQEDKKPSGGKDTNKQEDKKPSSGKDTNKQEDKKPSGGKDTNKQEDKKPSGGKENNKEEDKKPSSDKDNNNNTSKEEDKTPSGLSDELTTIIDKIYEIKDPGLRLMSSTVDLTNLDMVKYNTGLKDVSKVKEIVVSEAMIISQAYSLALVRVKDSADAKSVAEEMLEEINPRKWICVGADDLKIVTYQDVVMLIMLDSNFADTVTSNDIVNAFKEICGGKLDLELKK